MRDRCGIDQFDVVRDHVIAPLHPCRGFRHRDDRKRRARACALQHRCVRARGVGQTDRVLKDLSVHKDVVHRDPDLRKSVAVRDAVNVVQHIALLFAGQKLQLVRMPRIAERQLDHEPVELRIRQKLCAACADRVLRCDDDERIRHRMRDSVDGDVALLHRFEQRGLRAARGAVQLVRQKEIAQDRAGLVDHLPGRFVVEREPDDVAREHIGRELHAVILQSERFRERKRHGGFADAGNVLQQDMPAREDRQQRHDQHVVLADNRLFEFHQNRFRIIHVCFPISSTSLYLYHNADMRPNCVQSANVFAKSAKKWIRAVKKRAVAECSSPYVFTRA